jgi:hypothetical protein
MEHRGAAIQVLNKESQPIHAIQHFPILIGQQSQIFVGN